MSNLRNLPRWYFLIQTDPGNPDVPYRRMYHNAAGDVRWKKPAGELDYKPSLFSDVQIEDAVAWAHSKGYVTRKILDKKTKATSAGTRTAAERWPHLSGDLDCDPKLLDALELVAKDIGVDLHVNYGKRTYAEQKALYDRLGPGVAARPGTSRHETGLAADVVRASARWQNLRDIPGAAAACRNRGLHFPVSHEAWHVERVGT